MKEKKKVLICPLDWGLGHATRDIPLIKKLIGNSFEVIIAAYGNSYIFLKSELPELKIIQFPGLNVCYSNRKSQVVKMFFLVPKIIYWTIKENLELRKIIKKENIDIVISDNRFGLWNRKTYNIFITHQLKVKFPGWLSRLEFIYKVLLKFLLNKYNECWIPDFKDKYNLSGELSHLKNNLKDSYYLGPLSRFKKDEAINATTDIDILFLLSGPEPQRTIFENIIFDQTKNTKLKLVIVRGSLVQSKNKFSFPSYNLLNAKQLSKIIGVSKLVVCRSGYSSIMDLVTLNKQAVLVPTPGQTEQEYLAQYLKSRKMFYSVDQDNFNLMEAIENVFEKPNFQFFDKQTDLDDRILKLRVCCEIRCAE